MTLIVWQHSDNTALGLPLLWLCVLVYQLHSVYLIALLQHTGKSVVQWRVVWPAQCGKDCEQYGPGALVEVCIIATLQHITTIKASLLSAERASGTEESLEWLRVLNNTAKKHLPHSGNLILLILICCLYWFACVLFSFSKAILRMANLAKAWAVVQTQTNHHLALTVKDFCFLDHFCPIWSDFFPGQNYIRCSRAVLCHMVCEKNKPFY